MCYWGSLLERCREIFYVDGELNGSFFIERSGVNVLHEERDK